jgi:signal peptidase I
VSRVATDPYAFAPHVRARGSSSALRRLVSFAAATAVGLGAGLALAAAAPVLFCYETLTVLSGSMAPAIRSGDLVVDARIAPLEARVGDVVTFTDPEDRSRLVTHRVRRLRVAGGLVHFLTKGDANNATERWTIAKDGRIGRVEYRLPKLGYVSSWGGSRFGRLVLIVLPALLLGALELRRIWQPKGRDHSRAAGS